ncbi:unnamed protein product [Enterobius vermicularis]|uniref:NOT2_3_5 domain-containing protein n=1 Tax=Enterobius vermicularis TaxID=51028 RepID=A0A0N4VJQ1_ENTVE|nr:unnamed protein product [Enterobius vermicularis]
MSSGGTVIAGNRNQLSSLCRSSLLTSETIINESEFPSLGVRSSPSPGFPSVPTTSYSSSSPVPHNHLYSNKDVYSTLQRAPYANLMRPNDSNSVSSSNVEFRIQNEDFPALPGANHVETGHGQMSLGSNGESVLNDSRYPERSCLPETKTGIQTFPDGTVKNIPPGMLCDQFGMAGLLTFLRAIEREPNVVSLALGHDLASLGLNLNAPDRNLHTTFGGPWADFPCRTQDLDAKVPEEYLTNVQIRDKLPNIKSNKLSEDVLFYLFYNCPGEFYQVAAASELYSRDWRFHKSQRVWLTRSQYGGVKEQTVTYEKGSYNVFDPVQWRKIPKDMTLEYKELEERPKLPQQLQQSGQQAGQSTSVSSSQNGS